MGGEKLPVFADVEVCPDEPAAISALQHESPASLACSTARRPLPGFAGPLGVVDIGRVTRIRPDNVSIRAEGLRPGLLYRQLVTEYARDRLVLNFADLRPFGHPFHDDLFAILRALGQAKGRLALCCVEAWYLERHRMYTFIRVKFAPDGIPAE